MSKAKRIFEKVCSVVVILYFVYFLFFIKIEKEIISLYERFWKSFWLIVKGNSVAIIISSFFVSLVVIGFIDWILDDNIKKGKKKTENKEELAKTKKQEILLNK